MGPWDKQEGIAFLVFGTLYLCVWLLLLIPDRIVPKYLKEVIFQFRYRCLSLEIPFFAYLMIGGALVICGGLQFIIWLTAR